MKEQDIWRQLVVECGGPTISQQDGVNQLLTLPSLYVHVVLCVPVAGLEIIDGEGGTRGSDKETKKERNRPKTKINSKVNKK